MTKGKEREAHLSRGLEFKIVDAVQPFAAAGGNADAFAKRPGEHIMTTRSGT